MTVSLTRRSRLLPGLAAPRRQRLPNGVEMVSLPLEGAPLVCLDFWCRAGSAFEQPGENGMAHFLEHMVFKGSAGLAAGEFDSRVEALGGSSNAATGFDDVHYHVLIPAAAAAEALELLLDLVLHPSLEADCFGMERRVVLEELAQSEDQPEEVVVQNLLSRACPGHPYGEPILGRREALLAQSPEAMAAFHRRLYGGGRCVLALSGDLPDDSLVARAAAGPLAGLEPVPEPQAPPHLGFVPGEHRLSVPRLEAARLLMAWWQPPAAASDALLGGDLATTLLAEGRRSRLVDRLRERLRIVESVDLDLHPMECGSLALLEAVCDPADLGRVRREIEAVVEQLAAEPVPAAEWDRGRRLVANGYRFGLEAAAGVAGLIGNNALWNRPDDLEVPLQLLQGWTPERLMVEVLHRFAGERAFVLEAVPA